MLKIADRYIIKKFIFTLIFILAMLSLIIVVFDASEKIDKFLQKDVPTQAILHYYFLNFLPYVLDLISPLFIFISALFITSRMAYNSEIVAFLSSGTSFFRLLRPYLISAALLAGVIFYLKGWVVPNSNQGMIDFERAHLNKHRVQGNDNLHRRIETGRYFYFDRYRYKDTIGDKFSYEEFDGLTLKLKLTSTYLKWNDAKRKWYAHKYFMRKFTPDGEVISKGDTFWVDLKCDPTAFTRTEKGMTALTNPELAEFIVRETASGNPYIRPYRVELYQRYAFPFASFILIMIAVAVSSRKVRGGTGTHLMLGLLIAVTFVVLVRFTSTFAQQSSLNPMVAVWIPNIFFIFLAIFMIYKAPK
ncbi:MAG: LptF/LptG family permease [Bacteroidetes bacterium]|nr:LptF/LptG family permease [Bacteroidota bacterium]